MPGSFGDHLHVWFLLRLHSAAASAEPGCIELDD